MRAEQMAARVERERILAEAAEAAKAAKAAEEGNCQKAFYFCYKKINFRGKTKGR